MIVDLDMGCVEVIRVLGNRLLAESRIFGGALVALASGQKWYAVQVQPRREAIACAHLSRQSFRPFAPRIARNRRHAGRVMIRHEPLFPGYVFVSLDLERERWRSINGTIGVSRLVMFGDQPARLPDGFVEGLAQRSDDLGLVGFESALQPGDAVRIVGGALDDVIGTLISADDSRRVMILVDLLSGPRQVEVSRSRIIAA